MKQNAGGTGQGGRERSCSKGGKEKPGRETQGRGKGTAGERDEHRNKKPKPGPRHDMASTVQEVARAVDQYLRQGAEA
jgi:hypothetical protein